MCPPGVAIFLCHAPDWAVSREAHMPTAVEYAVMKSPSLAADLFHTQNGCGGGPPVQAAAVQPDAAAAAPELLIAGPLLLILTVFSVIRRRRSLR